MGPIAPSWHKVAAAPEAIPFNENRMTVVTAGDKKVCVARHQDRYFAFAYTCPHAGGVLAEGCIDAAGNVVCPLHRYKFSVINGYNVSGEGYKLKTYPLELRADGIYIRLDV